MSSRSYWLRVNGLALSDTVTWSPPTWETLADGGCGQASFELGGSRLAQVRTIRAGTAVDIMLGATPLWAGEVVDFDPGSGEVNLAGLAGAASRFQAIDGSGNATLDTSVATGEAAERGWLVSTRVGTFGVVNGTDEGLSSVAERLNQYGDQVGQRWGVDGRRRLYFRTDPVAPKWMIVPGAIALSGTTEGGVSHYLVRYFNGTSNLTTVVAHPAAHLMARSEEPLDVTDRGTLTLGQAQAIGAGRFALASSTTAWASGATVNSQQIRTIGDSPAALMDVRAGEMVRVLSAIPSGSQSALWFDVVIGKTRYTAGEDVIYLEPANTAPRNLADVIAAA